MLIYAGSFFKCIKYCLVMFGLWPYQSTISKRISNGIFGMFAISIIVPMALGLRQKTSTDVVIFSETMAAVIMIFGGLVQCTMMYFRTDLVKELHTKIHMDWEKLNDATEIAILRAFFCQGKTLAILFTVISISSFSLFTTITYSQLIYERDILLNQSRFFPYYSNRWVLNESTQNLQCSLHSFFGILYGLLAYVVVMTTYICSVKHVCGMYAIVGYRLKNMIKSKNEVDFIDERDFINKLLRIVLKHRETIEGTRLIAKIYGTSFFIVESCLLICISLLIFDINYNLHDLRSIFKIFLIIVSFIIYLFQIHHGGEEIIQFSNHIHLSIVSIKWYLTSIKVKKMLLIVLQRSSKTDVLLASIMTLSLKNFLTVIKISWSLAMILVGKNTSNNPRLHTISINSTVQFNH